MRQQKRRGTRTPLRVSMTTFTPPKTRVLARAAHGSGYSVVEPGLLLGILSKLIPLDRHPLQRIPHLAQVIAVTGHPVEAGHSLGDQLVGDFVADVDLGAADGQEGMVDDLGQ